MLQELPRQLVREHVKENSIGEQLTEEYNVLMFHLSLMGHSVRFMPRAKWTELLLCRGPQEWRKELADVDVVIDGYWPYECADKHALVRQQLDELCSVVASVCICPSPADTLFAAHKSRYHAHLERTFSDRRVVIPSVYLSPGCSLATVEGAISELMAAVETSNGLVLKRGLSGSGRQVHFLDAQSIAGYATHLHRLLNSSDASGVATLWLLQPLLPEFRQRHELKLYFDINGRLLCALASTFLPRRTQRTHVKLENGDVEVIELRRDNAQQWLAHGADEAIALAQQVRREVLRVAPSLAPLLRFDMIRTDRWGFLVNEVEHFGDAWLQLPRSSSSELAANIAMSVLQWSNIVQPT